MKKRDLFTYNKPSKAEIEDIMKKVVADNGGELDLKESHRDFWSIPSSLLKKAQQEIAEYGNFMQDTQNKLAQYGLKFQDEGVHERNDLANFVNLEDAHTNTLLRLLDMFPAFVDLIVTELGDRLKEKGVLKFSLKQDYNKLKKAWSTPSEQVLNKLVEQEEDDYSPIVFQLKVLDKIIDRFQDFIQSHPDKDNEEDFKNVFLPEFTTWYDHINEIVLNPKIDKLIEKSKFICQLKPGDTFHFMEGVYGQTKMEYKEFIYIGSDENGSWYRDTENSYTCNVYKPVYVVFKKL